MEKSQMDDWFRCWFDEDNLYRRADPPGAEAWSDSLAWADVIRVCLEMEDFLGSDRLYIFTRQRPESYVFPLASEGGSALIGELVRRQLLDAELAITSASGEGLYCWPEIEQ